jgi:hypothetical protein
LKAATEAGDHHPSLVQDAEGTRFAADLASSKDLVWDWSWAYLIGVRGRFKSNNSHGGYGPRRGSALSIVVVAKTGQPEDFGVSNHYPDLGKVGKVATDYPR